MENKLMRSKGQQILTLFFFLILCFGVSVLSSLITASSIPTWYDQLNRPALTPPNWIFGPAWTLLYFLMALSAWLVWKDKNWSQCRGALSLFFLQLLLNGIWSVLFFGLQRPDLAFLEIIILWLAIGLTLFSFWQAKPLAGVLLIPYWAWVGFAAYLNFGFWRLNP